MCIVYSLVELLPFINDYFGLFLITQEYDLKQVM